MQFLHYVIIDVLEDFDPGFDAVGVAVDPGLDVVGVAVGVAGIEVVGP